MTQAIQTRELIVLDGLGIPVRGTHHKTPADRFGAQSDSIGRNRVGLLFLAGLAATRASTGDSAVYWADFFAESGYPSFRVDLPGYGDSDGELPTELLEFINLGGYAPVVSAIIKQLVARFRLSGVVLMGHCSGAVSAVYTAAADKECKGLILMEPYFFLPPTARPEFRRRLHIWAMQSRFGGLLSKIFDLLKEISLFLRGAVPENANVPLICRWKELVSAGLPILILKVPGRTGSGTKQKIGEFDFLKYVLGLAGRRSQVVVKLTSGANHSFANRLGREAVRQQTTEWLNAFFPVIKKDEFAVETLSFRNDPMESYSTNQENCLQR